ncbi:MAG: hypothetical protein HAW65_01930 [Alphaproteobacteria bacterium]|nr:hypothetical protein [Alphaproteobacteria bacterium]MBE8220053.1 hypothetical protein [Alphaproteobacteria bacterium]
MPDNIEMRLDKWLWHARFYKTRARATQFVKDGKVRINGTRTSRASAVVHIGDVLTFPLTRPPTGAHICIVEVLTLPTQRTSAKSLPYLCLISALSLPYDIK